MYGDYTYQIYQYLQTHLPQIESSLSSVNSLLSSIDGTLKTIQSGISSMAPDLSDLRKLLLWFLFAWLSTRLLRWRYRV